MGWHVFGQLAKRNCGFGRFRTEEVQGGDGLHLIEPDQKETTMAVLNRTKAGAISALAAIAAAVTLSVSAPAGAQTKAPAAGKGEQFFPVLVYRTGAYAPNGTPWANGYVDYLKLVNAQGGINGVTITFEECENRLCNRSRGRVLRAAERQGPDRRDAVPSTVHRHHISR